MSEIKSFTDLQAWQHAHQLAKRIYDITESFEKKDAFGLTSQMQRSALSVSSNIAEGFGRRTQKDTAHFYIVACGSLTELQNQLLLAKDTGRITKERFNELADKTVTANKLLNGLIRSVGKARSD